MSRKTRKRGRRRLLVIVVLLALIVFGVFARGLLTSGRTTTERAQRELDTYAEKNDVSLDAYPEALVQLYARNPDARDFVRDYPKKKDLTPTIDLSGLAGSETVPLLLQWDERWGYREYNESIIGLAGCGPTCLSMVTIYLTGDTTKDPLWMCRFAEQHQFNVPGSGSKWALISEGGQMLGLDVTQIPLDKDRIYRNLDVGNPIIVVVGPGDFTTDGHFLVLTGHDGDRITLNDPNSTTNSGKSWDYDTPCRADPESLGAAPRGLIKNSAIQSDGAVFARFRGCGARADGRIIAASEIFAKRGYRMEYRLEHDTMGEVRVPADRYWGAQTQRSFENFRIGTEKIPPEVIRAFAVVKLAAARANAQLGVLDARRAGAIETACHEILDGSLDGNFPLAVWQTGSGTQTNMNVNEVIAHRANELLGETLVHPNDHVNCSQSSNDTFPTAMHVAARVALEEQVLPAIGRLTATLDRLSAEYRDVVKIGRTHLQDAVPLTLGQEISGWSAMLGHDRDMIVQACRALSELALGGTAVGTGLNAPAAFGDLAAEEISELLGYAFLSAPNKFHALTSKDQMVFAHGALKALAADLMKIANDVRWLASGPRCGIGELIIPANEPGSSIMPGKVNPTQCEAVTMVAVQVMGNDTAIGIAASQGNFQLNVFLPVTIYNFLQSARLLADAMDSFEANCVSGIRPNYDVIQAHLDASLMLVTALNPHIGYENAAKIAKHAHATGQTLKAAAVELGLLTAEEFDAWVRPENMVHPKQEEA